MTQNNMVKAQHTLTDGTKQWVEGYFVALDKTTYCFKEDYDANPNNSEYFIITDEPVDWGMPNRHLKISIDHNTVCRRTGQIDKHGKMIYENDIVKTKYGRTCQVKYVVLPGYIGFDFIPYENEHLPLDSYDLWLSDNLEVVGNVLD